MGNRRARAFMLQKDEDAAWERVHNEPRFATSDVHARGIGMRRLQLMILPSFEQASVWEVRQSQDWKLYRPRVIETYPEVVVVGHEQVPFESAALVAYLERVTALNLPLRPDQSGCGGLDGISYECAVFGDLSSAWRFRWWSTSPEHWRPLVELAEEMHQAFSAAIGQNAPADSLD